MGLLCPELLFQGGRERESISLYDHYFMAALLNCLELAPWSLHSHISLLGYWLSWHLLGKLQPAWF